MLSHFSYLNYPIQSMPIYIIQWWKNPGLKKVKKKTRIYPGLKSFLFWFLIFCHFFSVLISDLVNQHGDFPSYGNFSNFFWWVFGVGFLVPTKIVYVLVAGYLGGRGGGRDLHRLQPQVQTHGLWPTELTGKSQIFYYAAYCSITRIQILAFS